MDHGNSYLTIASNIRKRDPIHHPNNLKARERILKAVVVKQR
jgi:hypothetical protein